jgi:hypothetical protein
MRRKKKLKNRLVKRWEIKNKITITIRNKKNFNLQWFLYTISLLLYYNINQMQQ